MFPDHDNPSTAAAAAPAQDSESEKAKNEEKPGSTGVIELVADVKAAKEEATAAPFVQADGGPRPEKAAAPRVSEAAAVVEQTAGFVRSSNPLCRYCHP